MYTCINWCVDTNMSGYYTIVYCFILQTRMVPNGSFLIAVADSGCVRAATFDVQYHDKHKKNACTQIDLLPWQYMPVHTHTRTYTHIIIIIIKAGCKKLARQAFTTEFSMRECWELIIQKLCVTWLWGPMHPNHAHLSCLELFPRGENTAHAYMHTHSVT